MPHATLLAACAVSLYGVSAPGQEDLASGGSTMAAMWAELPTLLAVLQPTLPYVVVDPENGDLPTPAISDSVELRCYQDDSTGEYTLVSVVLTTAGPGLCISPNGSALASALSLYVVPAGCAPEE